MRIAVAKFESTLVTPIFYENRRGARAEERIATPTSGRIVRGTELRPAIKVSRIRRNRSRIGTGHFAMSRLRDQPFVIRQRVDVDLALWKWKFNNAFAL